MAKRANGMGFKSLGIAAIALSLAACSTTSGVSTAQNQGAPITYKVDQVGAVRTAAVTTPSYEPSSVIPEAAMPSAPVYVAPVAKPEPAQPILPSPGLDTRTVDTDLYAHQRVGKTYSIFGKSYTPRHQPDYDVTGTASWYGDKFHGKPTATGELYDMNDLTAAHKTLPLNSMVYVTNVKTGKGLMVRVNDRGPFVGDRIIDLSRASAKALGFFNSGLVTVRVQYAGPADPLAAKINKKAVTQPVLPKWEPETDTGLVAESPTYKPLRELGQDTDASPARPVSVPQQYPFEPSQVQGQDWRNAIPPAAAPFNPLSVEVPEGDAPVTLTIKGPVHLASDKANTDGAKPEFIPAVNYRQIPAEK